MKPTIIAKEKRIKRKTDGDTRFDVYTSYVRTTTWCDLEDGMVSAVVEDAIERLDNYGRQDPDPILCALFSTLNAN